jgi:hypothetical protein
MVTNVAYDSRDETARRAGAVSAFRENIHSAGLEPRASLDITYGPGSFLVQNNGRHDGLSGDSKFRIAITPEDKEEEERGEHNGKTAEEDRTCTRLKIIISQMEFADTMQALSNAMDEAESAQLDRDIQKVLSWKPPSYSLLDIEPFDPLSDENFDPFADFTPDYSLTSLLTPTSFSNYSLSASPAAPAKPTILNTSIEEILANPDLELAPVDYSLASLGLGTYSLGTNLGKNSIGYIPPSASTTTVAGAEENAAPEETNPENTAMTEASAEPASISAAPPEGKTFSSAPDLDTTFNANAAGTSPYSLASPGAKLQPQPTYSLAPS